MSIKELQEIERLKKENLELKQKLTLLRQETRELYKFAYKDSLTPLYNRRGMHQALTNLDKNVSHAIVMCDIDCFKSVNDTYGHDVGDVTIKKIGELIDAMRREDDFAARLGGDEFIIVLKNCSVSIAEKKCITLSRLMEDNEKSLFGFHLAMSFGISEYNPKLGFEQALKNADIALYESKNTGKNKI